MDNKSITTPICDFTREYASSGYSRFHMPGHKGSEKLSFSSLPFSLDITEIKGADSLYEAEGIIARSEENASFIFGTAATFFSVEGSSQCIRAMLALVTKWGTCPSEKRPLILAARNVHRAFITAAALLDFDVEWLYAEESTSLCSCPVTASQVEEKLRSMEVLPDAVYLTSPDYLGNLQDIRGISDAAHSFGVPLLVDNAHGSYLKFLEPSQHPVDLGADICCDSAHKTFPALTGCAYLHISRRASASCIENAKKAMAMFGSTSPSYILLQSLDMVNKLLAGSFRQDLADHVNKIIKIKQILRLSGWNVYGDCDFTGDFSLYEAMKITVDVGSFGYTGAELAQKLRESKIECEYADPDFLVLMPSPYTSSEDYERLTEAMISLSKSRPVIRENKLFMPVRPLKALSIREAAFSPSELIPAEECAGRICADTALSCPPAVPLIVCGETIPAEAIRTLKHYGFTSISVVKN